jgi:hypothetical protein
VTVADGGFYEMPKAWEVLDGGVNGTDFLTANVTLIGR